MPCVAFEPKIPVSEQAKTVHALDRSATVIGKLRNYTFDTNEKIITSLPANKKIVQVQIKTACVDTP
jgi:hypothetical protein